MRNISAKADGVGDTLPATDFNANLRSELQNVVTSSDQSLDPEGGPDTDVEMLGKAITIYANASQYYQDSGAANAYVLARVGNLKALVDYIDGTTVIFKAGNSNTGASTINVDSLGVKDLVDSSGFALIGGEVIQNQYVVARYNSSTDDFEIILSHSAESNPLPTANDALLNLQVDSAGTGYELVGPLSSFKNKIINGNFEQWQYSTSQTASGYGSDDRWSNEHSGSTKTHSQQSYTLGQTDVPGNPEFYSQTVFTTASAASNYVRKTQRIENVSTLSGQDAVLSFYAMAGASLNIATELLQNFGTTGSPSSDVTAIGVTTHALTTSWTKYEVPIIIPSISGKTLGTDGNDYLEVIFWLEAGSNYDARTNTLGNQSGTVSIDRVQLEIGDHATDFESRHELIEYDLCRRYYYKWNITNDNNTAIPGFATSTTTVLAAFHSFFSKMRTAPSITQSGSISSRFGATSTSTLSFSSSTSGLLTFNITGGTAPAVGDAYLIFVQSTNYLEFDAEL